MRTTAMRESKLSPSSTHTQRGSHDHFEQPSTERQSKREGSARCFSEKLFVLPRCNEKSAGGYRGASCRLSSATREILSARRRSACSSARRAGPIHASSKRRLHSSSPDCSDSRSNEICMTRASRSRYRCVGAGFSETRSKSRPRNRRLPRFVTKRRCINRPPFDPARRPAVGHRPMHQRPQSPASGAGTTSATPTSHRQGFLAFSSC
ncbi:hypothetical protein BLA18628_03315 [Burkholderia aenigmatica]|nr:hypothetical protein BLA18628_03315 [Burkholderia aenigmatica]